jgi:DNA repair protein RecN (Recombination protein N)
MNIEFHPGLNILSGETGAGKSMIIDAINFVLGERPGKDFMRHGTDAASVEALITAARVPPEFWAGLDTRPGDDGQILLSRGINAQNKSYCKINGRSITVGMLKELSAMLVDVHGQHEHQSLLDPAKHVVLLDRFCGEAIETEKVVLGVAIRAYKDVTRQIRELFGEGDRAAQLEDLTFQRDEIREAALKEDDEQRLTERAEILRNAEKLSNNVYQALELLYGGDSDEDGAIEKATLALNRIMELAEIDPSAQELADSMAAVQSQLTDIMHELRRYADNLRHDPEELNAVNERMDLIYKLKRKYGGSVAEILKHYQAVEERLDFFANSAEILAKLNMEKRRYTEEILNSCAKISAMRKTAAETIKAGITDTLRELGMRDAVFGITVERKKEFSSSGYDRVEFLISPNQGEEIKPLAEIASGGEMSRVMLAIKSVLADVDNIETFIFDEIDTGVSGRTAQMVAEKLAELGGRYQILCITHLPQIAAMGDRNFLIEKRVEGQRTVSEVFALDDEACISELARLIGGAEITKATKKAAAEMKKLALKNRKG